MSWTMLKLPVAAFISLGFAGCIAQSRMNKPGINASESRVLILPFSLEEQPHAPSAHDLHQLFMKSMNPDLDGERALKHKQRIRAALFQKGDEMFSQHLSRESNDVILRNIYWIDPMMLERQGVHSPSLLRLKKDTEETQGRLHGRPFRVDTDRGPADK